MAEINLKKLLNESMLKEIDQDCIILNEEQADELYGGAEWGYYGNCSFGNCWKSHTNLTHPVKVF